MQNKLFFCIDVLIIFFENDIIYSENRGDILEIVITFFRDVLDGPVYIAVAVLNSILICSCIGYMGEQYLNKKKEKEKFKENYVDINSNGMMAQVGATSVGMAQSSVTTMVGAPPVSSTAAPVVGNVSSGYTGSTTQENVSINNQSV